jgi:hypothetical protein
LCQVITVKHDDTLQLVLFAGGVMNDGISSAVFALEGDSWIQLPPMKTSRSGHVCSVLNDEMIVIGGYGAEQSMEVYDIVKKTWSVGPRLPTDLVNGHLVLRYGNLSLIFMSGFVVDLVDNMTKWKVMPSVGTWAVMGRRQIFTAPVVTKDMLKC